VILLDTQVILWLTTDARRVTPAAAGCIREASRTGDEIAIAGSTLWEVAMTYSKGGIRVPGTLVDYLEILERNFSVLPMTGAIAAQAMLFSERYPRDPTDRIIGATALIHGATLITADRKILESGEVDCVW
jgi:PIN domain nuclease of toxin-antitoxin system